MNLLLIHTSHAHLALCCNFSSSMVTLSAASTSNSSTTLTSISFWSVKSLIHSCCKFILAWHEKSEVRILNIPPDRSAYHITTPADTHSTNLDAIAASSVVYLLHLRLVETLEFLYDLQVSRFPASSTVRDGRTAVRAEAFPGAATTSDYGAPHRPRRSSRTADAAVHPRSLCFGFPCSLVQRKIFTESSVRMVKS